MTINFGPLDTRPFALRVRPDAPAITATVAEVEALKADNKRLERAESLLCALAFDHARIHGDHSCPTWTEFGADGHCAFCEAEQ